MMIKRNLILIILLSPFIAKAQYGYITGQLSDRFGPLSNAVISIKDSPYGTFTDDNGYFAFEIDTGYYQLVIDLTGYNQLELAIRLSNLEQKELDIELESILMDADVSVGTKSTESQNQLESPVPIDLILEEDLINTGEVELGPALHQLLPNFYSSKQSADDPINLIDPVSLRGLGPDQLLVLVNGKRRHKSAFLNVNDVFGKGTAGPDLNTIPISAISKIEILRDGASSQYGSDAIAGVMNIVLKERTSSTTLSAYTGITTKNDGWVQSISFNTGFGIKRRGFVNLTGSFLQQNAVNRAGGYEGPIFGEDSLDTRQPVLDFFFNQTGFPNRTIYELGSSEFQNGGLFLNGNYEVNDDFDFYLHGGITSKIGHVDQLYRLPISEEQVVNFWYPLGYSPKQISEILDRSLVVGFRGNRNGWYFDTSYGHGNNAIDITVENSLNASMGILSPFNSFAGGYQYDHDIINFETSRIIAFSESHLDVALGAEFRIERYRIIAGEENSYINGGDTTSLGEPRETGIQGYRGIRDEDALEEIRTNGSAYLELDYSWKGLGLSGAVRQEEYSDFGSQLNYKLAGRYKFFNQLTLRSSFSTGFKAPSLPQIYYQRTSNFLADDGFFSTVAVVNTETQFIGNLLATADQLEPELSRSFNIGITSAISRNASLSLDGYSTEIKDRIGLTGRFSVLEDEILSQIYEDTDIAFIQFFGNLIDTRTYGLDAVFATQFPLGKSLIKYDSRFSYLQNEVTNVIENEEIGEGLVDRTELSRIETYVPEFQWRNTLSITLNKLSMTMSHTGFGKTTYLHFGDDELSNWAVNEATGVPETRDQTFSPIHTFNFNARYRVLSSTVMTIGAINITNQFPDKLGHSENTGFGVLTYSPNVRPIDLRGTYLFLRLNVNL